MSKENVNSDNIPLEIDHFVLKDIKEKYYNELKKLLEKKDEFI